ncbi:MAG: PaeR7I family type II restriction endonuclease [Candidatus Cryptobacteroides sp.]
MGIKSYNKRIANAVESFWQTKEMQLNASVDTTNRGAVVGGKQLDAFVTLLKDIATEYGVPEDSVYTRCNYLPGYFRSSKNWDLLIISPGKKLIAAIELKSQIGSYGNNFNNRTEEALGSAVDLWTAYREKQFPDQTPPWLGYLTVVGKDADSTSSVQNHEPHFKVRPEFNNATYLDRYKILCQKLMLERHYSMAAIVCTSGPSHFENLSEDTSIDKFINSFIGHLIANAYEFGK